MQLDDRYTEGVWYDLETGDYCRFVETDEGVGLVEPDGSDENPYYVFDEHYDDDEDIAASIEADFRKVPERAVEEPIQYLMGVIDAVQMDEYGRTGGPTMAEQRGIGYVRQQVEVVERDDE